MPITAQHPAVCEDCGDYIQVGDVIVLAGGAGWVHQVCPKLPQPRPVCPTCFQETALNGSCGCQ